MFGQAMESSNLGVPDPDCIHRQTIPTPYFFVGDAAFPLKTYMLRPYPGKYLPDEERVFNYRLSRARRVIENTFGILVTKFRIFRRPIIAKPEIKSYENYTGSMCSSQLSEDIRSTCSSLL